MTNSPEINSKIKNIMLTLYALQLREDANEGYQKPAQNAENLWQNLQLVAEELNLDKLPDTLEKIANHLKSNPPLKNWDDLLYLLDKQHNIKFSQKYPKDYPLKGSFRATKAQDIYIAELSLFCQDKETKEIAISTDNLTTNFNPKGCLLPPTVKTTFGQIILLYAEPAVFEDYRKLADDCVISLTRDYITQKPEFVNQGELFNSPIFEYQNSQLEPDLEPGQICHILVWLKRNENIVNNITKEFDLYLRHLLLYQRKVLYAYYQGRYHYSQGQEKANHLEKKIPEFAKISQETKQETRLQKYREFLKEILTAGFEYRQCLRYLQECYNTIGINIGNFSESLKDIKTLTLPDDNLELWESFLILAQNKYQKQLEADINYLIAGQNLFQEMVATIRANLEIEEIETDRKIQETLIQQVTESRNLQSSLVELQKEIKLNTKEDTDRSRNLNITIGVVGGGMAVAGVVASSYTILKEPPTPLLISSNNKLYPFFESIALSVAIGVIPLLSWLIWLRFRSNRKTENENKNKPQ